jgi:hypothetical protein
LKGVRVVFRIIWRTVSELFGAVLALSFNTSHIDPSTNVTAIREQNQILSLQAENLSLRANGQLPFPVVHPESADTPNTSQTLRQIAIKATLPTPRGRRQVNEPLQ